MIFRAGGADNLRRTRVIPRSLRRPAPRNDPWNHNDKQGKEMVVLVRDGRKALRIFLACFRSRTSGVFLFVVSLILLYPSREAGPPANS